LATLDDLMRIEAEDIYKSRWFSESPDAQAIDGRAVPAG